MNTRTELDIQVYEALRRAVATCGYDMDALFATKERTRRLADMRAIVWSIYSEMTGRTYAQVGADMGCKRLTVYSGIERATEFCSIDRDFKALYDSVRNALAAELTEEQKKLINRQKTMAKFRFNARPIGITCIYDKDDPRLKKTTDIYIAYAGQGALRKRICHKTVSVTEAEKAVIESIAMRLFLDHKKIISREETPDGKVKVTGVIAVDVIDK